MPKKNTKKPSVKVKDLRAKKNPKGGAIYMKYGSIDGETADSKHKAGIDTAYSKIKFDPLFLNKKV